MAEADNRAEEQQEKKPGKIKRATKFLFDVPSWLALGFITETWGWLSNAFMSTFSIPRATHDETFEQAVERLNVTQDDLDKQAKLFLKSSWVFLACSILLIFYMVYIWHEAIFFARIVGIAVIALLWAQAFRFSFLLFQIKQRRLGCTVKQWFNWILRGQA